MGEAMEVGLLNGWKGVSNMSADSREVIDVSSRSKESAGRLRNFT